jgi:hypothetical protein
LSPPRRAAPSPARSAFAKKLYGDLTSYDGRPADYQVARIDSLREELGDVEAEFEALLGKELPGVNRALTKKKLQTIEPLTRKDWDAANSGDSAAPVKTSSESKWERD